MEEKNEIVFGLQPVKEALESGQEFGKVFVKRGLKSESFGQIRRMLEGLNIPIKYVPEEKLNQITRKNHQGVIAYTSPISFHQIEEIIPGLFEQGKNPLILVLDGVTDVRNFGAITRTAECAGVNAIVISSHGSVTITPDAVRASAGSIFNIPICRSTSLKRTLTFLNESGCQIVAASEKAQAGLYSIDFVGPTTIVLGDEGSGVSTLAMELSTASVSIPMAGKTNSLNVSVAAGVILFEVLRQRTILS